MASENRNRKSRRSEEIRIIPNPGPPKMAYVLEDIPTPDNGYYVLVTGANR